MGTMPPPYLLLFFAIVAEVVGTSALQASQQFTKLGPTLLVVAGYATAFYFLGLTLKYLPVGIVYAMWSGLGIVLIAIVGWIVFGQKLDLAAVLGIGFILVGVVILNLYSKSGH